VAMNRVIGATVFMTRSYLKEPLAFVSDLIIPLIMFMIVHLGTGRGVESLIGILIVIAWSSGSFALARKLGSYKAWRLMDMFIASPLKPIEFAIAVALAHLIIIVLPATIVTVIMILISSINPASLILLIASIIVAWITGITFGLYVYSKLADPFKISSTANLLNLLLIILPPVIYPISILPSIIQLISILLPTVSLKLVALHLVGISTGIGIPIFIPTIIVIVYATFFTISAIKQRIFVE
jgi:ABC-2 type transport system permease protein